MLNLFTRKTKKFFMTTVLFLTTLVSYSNPPENPPSEKTTVSGRVLDKKGSPIAFATVFIKDSTHGTMADENGNYSLKVHLGSHILCVSMLGSVLLVNIFGYDFHHRHRSIVVIITRRYGDTTFYFMK